MRIFRNNSLSLRKQSGLWFLVTGFMTVSFSTAFAQTEEKYIRQGNKSFENKKYADAEVSYKKSLNKNLKSYEGNFNLGDAYYKQGKYDEAAKQFDMLKQQNKDKKTNAANLHNLGNTLLKSEKYQESIEAYKQALKLNPEDEDTRYNLAYAQAMLREQQQQQQQNQDQKKDDKKDQQQQNQDQQQNQQQQQKQQQQKQEISKEDAERILQALNNDEKDKHKKKAKVAATRIKIDKDW